MTKASLKTAGVLGAFLLSAIATPALAGKPDWANQLDGTIVSTAVALSGGLDDFDDNGMDFDILVAAVVATGYSADPLNGWDDYTVFAPEDDAFLAAAGNPTDVNGNGSAEDEAVGILVGAFGLDGIRAILDYHVAEGVRNSKSVTQAKRIKMLDGNTISARDGFVDANNSDAGFVLTDVRVADGIIHVIDAVLLP
jgi:uncharacterized surface protein with fasciclin (FAS1) repeats